MGLWSEFGISEARTLFWDCMEKGKGFARRATFWDMLFGITMGRDENIGSFLMRMAMYVVVALFLFCKSTRMCLVCV